MSNEIAVPTHSAMLQYVAPTPGVSTELASPQIPPRWPYGKKKKNRRVVVTDIVMTGMGGGKFLTDPGMIGGQGSVGPVLSPILSPTTTHEAASSSLSGMFAFSIPPKDARRLAGIVKTDSPSAPEDMHVTLVYVPKVKDFSSFSDAVDFVTRHWYHPVDLVLTGEIVQFPDNDGDGNAAVVAIVQPTMELNALHYRLVAALRLAGYEPPELYDQYKPHITIGYSRAGTFKGDTCRPMTITPEAVDAFVGDECLGEFKFAHLQESERPQLAKDSTFWKALDDAGANVDFDVLGVWWDEREKRYKISIGDWATDETRDACEKVFGPEAEIDCEWDPRGSGMFGTTVKTWIKVIDPKQPIHEDAISYGISLRPGFLVGGATTNKQILDEVVAVPFKVGNENVMAYRATYKRGYGDAPKGDVIWIVKGSAYSDISQNPNIMAQSFLRASTSEEDARIGELAQPVQERTKSTGKGKGNWGHKGTLGKRGGSAPGSGQGTGSLSAFLSAPVGTPDAHGGAYFYWGGALRYARDGMVYAYGTPEEGMAPLGALNDSQKQALAASLRGESIAGVGGKDAAGVGTEKGKKEKKPKRDKKGKVDLTNVKVDDAHYQKTVEQALSKIPESNRGAYKSLSVSSDPVDPSKAGYNAQTGAITISSKNADGTAKSDAQFKHELLGYVGAAVYRQQADAQTRSNELLDAANAKFLEKTGLTPADALKVTGGDMHSAAAKLMGLSPTLLREVGVTSLADLSSGERFFTSAYATYIESASRLDSLNADMANMMQDVAAYAAPAQEATTSSAVIASPPLPGEEPTPAPTGTDVKKTRKEKDDADVVGSPFNVNMGTLSMRGIHGGVTQYPFADEHLLEGGPGSGDTDGHEFHGNQHTGGIGGGSSSGHSSPHGKVTSEREIHHSNVNLTKIVTLDNGSTWLEKSNIVYGSSEGEVLGYKVGEMLGANVPYTEEIASTVTRQEFVDGASSGWEQVDPDPILGSLDGQKIAVLDYVIGNADRHGNNWLVKDGRPVAIDNGGITLGQLHSQDARDILENSQFGKAWAGKSLADEVLKGLMNVVQDKSLPQGFRDRARYILEHDDKLPTGEEARYAGF